MHFLKASGFLFLVLLLLTAVVLGLGSRLPSEHVATVSAVVAATPERVWALLTEVQAQPRWRTGLKSVEMLPGGPGGPCWRELQSAMAMPLCVTASDAPRRRVVRISDPTLPFGGDWTYVLEPAGQLEPGGAGSAAGLRTAGAPATRITITEHGTTGPPMWRFVGHYLLGEDHSIRQYLGDLERVTSVPAPPGTRSR